MSKPVFIIAEIGSVHDGKMDLAKSLIEAAAECGTDAVKFQTHIAAAETLKDAPMPKYFQAEPRYQYFERTGFSVEEWKEIKTHCEKNNVEFISSPFSIEAVELLEEVGMKRYKIPSGEVTNLPMLQVVAATKKPVIISSGMSSWEELDKAIKTIQAVHNNITVLQCTSEYPCPPEAVGLNVMSEMIERYKLPVGLSDHTLTPYATFAAVALGATVIEKHFALSRSMYGSDAKHSLEPVEFKDMVQGIRAITAMLENPVDKSSTEKFTEMKLIFEKSVVSVTAIPKGTVITADMIGIKKPGNGIPAAQFDMVVGSTTAKNIEADTLLKEEDIIWRT